MRTANGMLKQLTDEELAARIRHAGEIVRVIGEEKQALFVRQRKQVEALEKRRGNAWKALENLHAEAERRYNAQRNVLANQGMAPEDYERALRDLAQRLGV